MLGEALPKDLVFVEVRDSVWGPLARCTSYIFGLQWRWYAQCNERHDGCQWSCGEYHHAGSQSGKEHCRVAE